MIYYEIVRTMLNEKIFPADMIQGKRILLVGANDAFAGPEAHRQTGAMLAKEWLLSQGAAECRLYGLSYALRHQGQDYIGLLEDVGRAAAAPGGQTELFDLVVVFSGMEKTAVFPRTISALRSIVREGGRICLLLRTPSSSGVETGVVEYEDNWRFEAEDLPELFSGDTAELALQAAGGRWLLARIRKNAGGTGARPMARIYHCRAGQKITWAEGRQLGYFRDQQCLSALGLRYGTDKNFYGHNYLDKYELLLRPLRDKVFTLLELGVFNGGSEKMWQEYFPLAQIVGVDIEERCRSYEDQRIRIEIMDLGEKENLEVLKRYQPTVIIDDASHIWSHQILALFTLFHALPSGGIYILEDMETSLNADLFPGYEGGSPVDAYSVCERIARVTASKRPDTGDLYAAEITAIGMATEFVGTMKGACVFVKR